MKQGGRVLMRLQQKVNHLASLEKPGNHFLREKVYKNVSKCPMVAILFKINSYAFTRNNPWKVSLVFTVGSHWVGYSMQTKLMNLKDKKSDTILSYTYIIFYKCHSNLILPHNYGIRFGSNVVKYSNYNNKKSNI